MLCDLNLVQNYYPNVDNENIKTFSTENFSPKNETRTFMLDIYMLGATILTCLVLKYNRKIYSSHINQSVLNDNKNLITKTYGMNLRTKIIIEIINLMLEPKNKRIYLSDLEEIIDMLKLNDSSVDLKVLDKLYFFREINNDIFLSNEKIYLNYGHTNNYDQSFIHEKFVNKLDSHELVNIFKKGTEKHYVHNNNYRFINVLGYQLSKFYQIEYSIGKYIAHIILMFPKQINTKTWEVMYNIDRFTLHTSILKILLDINKIKISSHVFQHDESFYQIYKNNNIDDEINNENDDKLNNENDDKLNNENDDKIEDNIIKVSRTKYNNIRFVDIPTISSMVDNPLVNYSDDKN
jgi:hypothetical protein